MRLRGKSLPRMALIALPLVMLSSLAVAQPLTLNVSPGSAGLTGLGYTPQGWLRIPVQGLYARGPDYTQPSGVRVGRGSRIPEWIDAAVMQNITVPGLPSGGYYDYFISPDRKIVVIDPQSWRVMRVLR
jgi:hypothetical protein